MAETIGAATAEWTGDAVEDRQQEETAEKMRQQRQQQLLAKWVSEQKVLGTVEAPPTSPVVSLSLF